MKRAASVLICQVLLLLGSSASVFAVADQFQSGDAVCFVGDSITRRGSYHAQVQLFYATRFPGRTIKYFNCGINGDTASDIVGSTYRLHTDILGHQPTVATIMLGMNDIGRKAYEEPSRPNAGKKAAQPRQVQRQDATAYPRVARGRREGNVDNSLDL
jgi:endoglucanase